MSVLEEIRAEAVAWMAVHYYAPTTNPTAMFRTAVRSVLNMPTSDEPLDPRHISPGSFNRARAAFTEITVLATQEGPVNVLAVDSMNKILGAVRQPDLSAQERNNAHTELMVEAVIHWVTYAHHGLLATQHMIDEARRFDPNALL